MAGTQYTSDLSSTGKRGLRKRLLTLFSKSVRQEDMCGKQWVHIFSDNRPCARHLLLCSLPQVMACEVLKSAPAARAQVTVCVEGSASNELAGLAATSGAAYALPSRGFRCARTQRHSLAGWATCCCRPGGAERDHHAQRCTRPSANPGARHVEATLAAGSAACCCRLDDAERDHHTQRCTCASSSAGGSVSARQQHTKPSLLAGWATCCCQPG